MPRNDIAAIIGLIVACWFLFAGPGRVQGLRDPRTLAMALFVFAVAFAVVWIVLRVLGY